ncbi:MAG: glycosyltransferase family 2 protein [Parcubacteria group bacterium]|nr:glycosyltransferase family 2 protein [Parcubacteria group bacterium]
MRLSVIIPAYNEAERLPNTLKAVDEYLRRQSYKYEILVVNDGSKDSTADVVRQAAESIKNLWLIDRKENRGKGYTVKQGMLAAHGDFRLFMDADNSTSVDQVERMWPWFPAQGGSASGGEKGFEVVIGSRDIKGAELPVPQSWLRMRLGDIFNLIVQTISGLWGIWDTQCGFKGFTRKAAEELFSRATIDRWAFDVEILVLAKKRKYKIQEIPVRWINDPNSRVKLSGMIKMLLEVLKIRINLWKGIYER